MRRINIDRSKCIRCLACVSACRSAHNGEEARNRVVVSDDKINSPIFCRDCDKPECVYACMSGAMRKDPKTGYVTYDKEQCVSCYMCIMACPYGVLKEDSLTKKIILKCDMCAHLNYNPQCVAKCPKKAITIKDVV